MRLISIISMCLLAVLFVACGESDDHGHEGHSHDHADHDHGDHAGHDHGDHAGHDHDDHEGHDHGDHDGHDHGGHDHGEEHALGAIKIGEHNFSVTQHGAITGQSEAVLTITYTGSAAPELRAWIGKADGRGSVKAKLSFDKANKHYHGHLEVPASLSDDAAIYLSVGETSGKIAFEK